MENLQYIVHMDAAYHHCPVHGHGTKYQQIPIINIPIKSYDEPSRYPLYWLIGINNVWAIIHKAPKTQPGIKKNRNTQASIIRLQPSIPYNDG